MKSTLILALIFLNTLISYGQNGHLEPATLNAGGGLELYYKNLNTLLYNGMTDKPYANLLLFNHFQMNMIFT
jgi:hypothetical protein